MSLKYVHVLFITLATALALGFGVWCIAAAYYVMSAISFAMAVALVVYGFWFIAKLKRQHIQ